jgi:hypothetical protein
MTRERSEHPYPLWCIDRNESDEEQFLGPFQTLEEARARLAEPDDPRDEQCLGPRDRWKIRRCRHIDLREAAGSVLSSHFDLLWEAVNEALGDGAVPTKAWANWEEELLDDTIDVRAAEQALVEWARTHLRAKVYECEPES